MEVTKTINMALALLPVASTRSCRLPEEYSARCMEMESGAAVRVAVGLERTCVAVGCIGVAVEVDSPEVDVGGTPV